MAQSTMATPSICNSAVTALTSWSASAPLTPSRSVIPVHDEYQTLANMVYTTQEEFAARFGALEARVDAEPQIVYHTVSDAIDNLRFEFENLKAALFAEVDVLVEKMRECARANDLVDEQGGALDEFLEKFTPQKTTPERSDEQE